MLAYKLADYVNEACKETQTSDFDRKHDAETRYIFFRGQSNASWKLEPSLLRKNKTVGEKAYYQQEDLLFNEALVHHIYEFKGTNNTIEKLAIMQHYGIPTRLMDVTRNFFVALFFACEDALTTKEDQQKDAKVFIFKTAQDIVKHYDDLEISVVSNFCRLNANEKGALGIGGDRKFSHEGEEICSMAREKLKQFIADDSNGFAKIDDEKIKKEIGRIYFLDAVKNNNHMMHQDGSFILFGDDAQGRNLMSFEKYADKERTQNLEMHEILIHKEDKAEVLKELNFLGINARVLYGDLGGFRKYIDDESFYALKM